MEKTELSTYSRINQFVCSKEKGTLFISDDFVEFGSNKNIRSALVRLCTNKILRRIYRGIYIKFEDKTPNVIQIANEISRKNGTYATCYKDEFVNSTHIVSFFTNGSTRTITLDDGCVLKFIHKL